MSNVSYLLVVLSVTCSIMGVVLAGISLGRLQQLSFEQTKLRWIVAYTTVFLIGVGATFRPLLAMQFGYYVVEAVVLAGLLFALLRTKKRWQRDGTVSAPPESNRAPLGDT